MTLKGWEWLDDNGNVVMTFTFKRSELDVWQDTTIEEYHKFIDFIRNKGFEPHTTDQHFHKIKGLE